jgi:predicted nucleic acid-binding protein
VKVAVVDASVVVKWVIPEDHSEAALRLLTEGVELHAPGHWFTEVTTTLWATSAIKRILTREQATARVQWIKELIVDETPVRNLIVSATEIAFDLHLTVYDTLYLALSAQIAAPSVTADRKLYDKVKTDDRYADLVVWVADLL